MTNAEQVDAAAAAWLARRDAGNWREEDQAELDAWLAASTAHRVAFLRIEAVWQQTRRLNALAGTRELGAPSSGARVVRKSPLMWAGIAAAILFAAIGLTVGYGTSRDFVTYSTSVGGLETVPLADGTKVTLNTDSKIEVALTEAERTIRLPRGEAFFDVAKDPERPFVIETGRMRVIAVGTQFSVWNEGDHLRVAVTEGRVRVESNDLPPIDLTPGDVASGAGGNLLVQHKPVEVVSDEYLSWRTGFLVFNDTPLAEVLKQFNRYNVTQIRLTDPELAEIRIGGGFRVTNVDGFLRLLERELRFTVVQQDTEIVLERAS